MHHTKDKGDQALAFVIADLTSQGIQVAIPISEHQKWDCIAVYQNKTARVQVKFAKANVDQDKIDVYISSSWADKHGNHGVPRKMDDFDILAVYCPTTKQCYYMAARDTTSRRSVTLRLAEIHRSQRNMHYAEDHIDPKQAF